MIKINQMPIKSLPVKVDNMLCSGLTYVILVSRSSCVIYYRKIALTKCQFSLSQNKTATIC